MKIFPLSEGTYTVDGSKHFVPFKSGEKSAKGAIVVEIQPFLIKTSKDLILLDAGLGWANDNNELLIYKNIIDAGYKQEQVTKVLISHLHKDHIGGLVNPFTHTANFENALHYVHKSEIEYGLRVGAPSYDTTVIEEFLQSANIHYLDKDRGFIDAYIDYEVTHAHANYHQVFWIHENEQVLFYGGDDAPQYGQMKRRIVAKYDFDGEKAAELRGLWWEEAKHEGWQFLFYHDIKTPVFDSKTA